MMKRIEESVLTTVVAIDDDPECLVYVREVLDSAQVEVVVSPDPHQGLELVSKLNPQIVLLDLVLPGVSGWLLFDRIRETSPRTQVVLMTGSYSTDAAVEAIKRGAADYLAKPFPPDRLRSAVERIAEGVSNAPDTPANHMVGGSRALMDALSLAKRVAPHFRGVLITGPTGSGKELMARRLHRMSPAAAGPFVACNCSAFSESLFESELFGHVRGAFTGAVRDHCGLFEAASGGVLFLDEVTELPLALQAKLLRAVEEREVRRLGSVQSRRVDVRLIAAANRNLRSQVEHGQFREDLFYRLAMVEIALPSLKERRDDIPMLVAGFLDRFGAEYGKRFRGVTDRARDLLSGYDWPGNVRELRNAVGYACMVCDGEWIDLAHLPRQLSEAASPPSISDVERRHVDDVLATVGGNRDKAAGILGISRATLYRRLARERVARPPE